ncbi:hypothetical protein QNA16_06260, partial [Gordonia alkanivorans]|nr:hypothetical protein [Gordonia alkanivorans]MDJ0099661.1 hypothetical protein [Gordonia alkanivorans]MDJ0492795.1 hypothetical protein [Gordonia alkanivorans]
MAFNGRNADPKVVRAKLARIWEPHVAPLNELANRIADAEGLPHGHVPYVDPDAGGIRARMLVKRPGFVGGSRICEGWRA